MKGLLPPDVSFVSEPSIGNRLETIGMDRKDLMCKQPTGQGSISLTNLLGIGIPLTLLSKTVETIGPRHSNWALDEDRELPQPSEQFFKMNRGSNGTVQITTLKRSRQRNGKAN